MSDESAAPVTVQYFYKIRWGFKDEWLDLFRRNHWPLLREGVRSGRMLDVSLHQPRFHGDGRAAWDLMVSITYRDWSAIQDHGEAQLINHLFPDRHLHRAEEQRRFELLDAHWDVPLEALDMPE